MNGRDSLMSGELRSRLRECRSEGGNGYGCLVTFDPDFTGFAGHFPGNPVVPGVCLVELVRVFAEEMLQCPLTMVELASCRFRRPVLAGETASCTLTVSDADGEELSLQGGIRVESAVACQARLKVRRA